LLGKLTACQFQSGLRARALLQQVVRTGWLTVIIWPQAPRGRKANRGGARGHACPRLLCIAKPARPHCTCARWVRGRRATEFLTTDDSDNRDETSFLSPFREIRVIRGQIQSTGQAAAGGSNRGRTFSACTQSSADRQIFARFARFARLALTPLCHDRYCLVHARG